MCVCVCVGVCARGRRSELEQLAIGHSSHHIIYPRPRRATPGTTFTLHFDGPTDCTQPGTKPISPPRPFDVRVNPVAQSNFFLSHGAVSSSWLLHTVYLICSPLATPHLTASVPTHVALSSCFLLSFSRMYAALTCSVEGHSAFFVISVSFIHSLLSFEPHLPSPPALPFAFGLSLHRRTWQSEAMVHALPHCNVLAYSGHHATKLVLSNLVLAARRLWAREGGERGTGGSGRVLRPPWHDSPALQRVLPDRVLRPLWQVKSVMWGEEGRTAWPRCRALHIHYQRERTYALLLFPVARHSDSNHDSETQELHPIGVVCTEYLVASSGLDRFL